MLLLAPLACQADLGGVWALSYVGQPDCVGVGDTGAPLSPPFTVELWMQLDPSASPGNRPLVAWGGLFELAVDTNDTLALSLGRDLATGYAVPFERGILYNVAAQYDGTEARLFVDGAPAALADAAYDRTPRAELWIGCNEAADSFWGVIDDVRVSKVARYTDTFGLSTEAYAADADTVALFPFDEGEGEEATDIAAGLVAAVAGPTWVVGEIGVGK